MKKYIKGRWVIGVKPFTLKQIIKVYWLLALSVLFTIYLIVASFWLDLYLVTGEEFLFLGSWIVVVICTATWFRREQAKNFIYKDPYKDVGQQ